MIPNALNTNPLTTMNRLPFLITAAVTCVPAICQTSYWIANRASSDIMRVSEWGSVLERVATPTTLRGSTTAPDNKVWIARFGSATMDIYDPATATFLPSPLLPSGSAYAIALDAVGHAWVTNSASAVHEFDAAGVFVQTYALPVGSALGITIDGQGNKWVAHRVAPASVSRIDPAGTVTNFPIVGATTLLPVGIVADYRGIAQPSHLWVTGDSASQIAEIDAANGATLNLYPTPFGSVAYPPTFDRAGRIWISSYGNGSIAQLDQASGAVLLNLTYGPSNNTITTDAFGRIRTAARVTFSGVGPPCEVRRIDPTTGGMEIPTLLQLGTFSATGTQAQLSTPWQYCLVVNQTGDLDGDGEANVTEILNGTSPIDATSKGNFRIESFGSTQNGSTPTFEVQASATTLWIAGFAGALIPATPVPGFGGNLRLDVSTIVLTSAGVGSQSLPIAIPADPALAGFEFFAQGVTFNGASFDFQNVSGMKVW